MLITPFYPGRQASGAIVIAALRAASPNKKSVVDKSALNFCLKTGTEDTNVCPSGIFPFGVRKA